MTIKPGSRRVAMLGNPNTGKTTIFNQLTGYNARVGNYAGVTVERKVAPVKGVSRPVDLIDLPGIYSIAARSPDEMVSVDVLLGNRAEEPEPPDAILVVLDASNLDRNLFLATQVMEAGPPCAFLLNMIDIIDKQGVLVDEALLSSRFGVPVFRVVGTTGQGLEAVRLWLSQESLPTQAPPQIIEFPEIFESELKAFQQNVAGLNVPEPLKTRFFLQRALLESGGMAEKRLVDLSGERASQYIDQARTALKENGISVISMEARCRYSSIGKLLEGVRVSPENQGESTSDRIDRVLLHPVFGTGIFLLLMIIVFQAIFTWSAPSMDLIEGFFSGASVLAESLLPAGPLLDFITGGVIAGVGGVLVFLPQIVFLFLFISLLEDCGYLARAAFLADRLFSKLGLTGRSFIPLLSSFACAIPGVMATRIITDPRDRLITILVAPLMSCSARLPVYTIMIAAFIPANTIGGVLGLQGFVLFLLYLVGPAVAILVALFLRGTLLKGAKPMFMMELPPYRMPAAKVVFHRLLESSGAFVKRAGTVIFAVSIIIWAASYYPQNPDTEAQVEAAFAERFAAAQTPEETEQLETEMAYAVQRAKLSESALGKTGHLIEPLVRPLGWDWRIGVGVIASFPAREVIISTLGIIFEVGPDADESSTDLQTRLQLATWPDGRPLFNIPVAVSIMVFFALCAQCAATLAVIRRETNSWKWPVFSFVYMTTLAWLAAFISYQVLSAILS
ncbi:MAG: ferrous iron transport protein B [Sumerlaeia bacterium]